MKKGTILVHNNNMGSSCSAVQKPERPSVASPNKEKPLITLKSSEFGSKDEAFFDSQAWLESDCEDDFFSVNGDFTPSRGSTPSNQISILTNAKSDRTFGFDKFPDFKSGPSPSPTGRKKLGDLFQETEEPNASDKTQETNGEHALSFQTKSEEPPASANSVSSGELTLSGEFKKKKKKQAGAKTQQCCLPRLGQSFSFSERRQKTSAVNCRA